MAALPRSPLAPVSFPDLPQVAGVRIATAATGVRYKGRDDVMLALLDPGTSVAGVYTRSATRSAAVEDCLAKRGNPSDAGAAILVNSGNANAFTGRHGAASVAALVTAIAERAQMPANRVFTASTGVIGEVLPHDRILGHLDQLIATAHPGNLRAAAEAIRTTDTFAKGAVEIVRIGDADITIAGIAKGSGMIAPDMATMLAYIFTDARIDQARLQALLETANAASFNCITVDGDTSTSDTVMLAATGASGIAVDGSEAFADALRRVMTDLAQQVVRDGEGATKFVEIVVTGAASDADAALHAHAIANSPLVKTALAGEDPNWGRIVMAIGKSGARADRDLLSIRFGDISVAREGWVDPAYREEQGASYMRRDALEIGVDLGLGSGRATVWTCDLTHGYVSINADYRS